MIDLVSGWKCLEHESESNSGTSKAETGLESRCGASGLGKPGGGGVAWSRGPERGRDGDRLGGRNSGAVGDGVASGVAGGASLGGVDESGVGWGVRGGLGRERRGGRVAAGAGGGSRAGNNGASLLGDTELGGVLVLASNVVDQLDAIAVGAGGGLKIGGGSPGEATAVGDSLSEGRTELDDVGSGTLEEEDGDGVGGSWLPGDGEGLAGGNDLVQGPGDGIAAGLANGSMELRSCEAGEEGDDGSLGEHGDGGGVCVCGIRRLCVGGDYIDCDGVELVVNE